MASQRTSPSDDVERLRLPAPKSDVPEQELRTCRKCGESKPYDDFYLTPGKDGFRLDCKKCCIAYKTEPKDSLQSLTFTFDKGLNRSVGKKLAESVVKRMALYRCDGLDALHDIAVMPLAQCRANPALVGWKYQAAQLLAGALNSAGEPTSEMDTILKQLDSAYRQNAPRIKAVRERVIEFEEQPEEKLIN